MNKEIVNFPFGPDLSKVLANYAPGKSEILKSWITKAGYPAIVISIKGEHNAGYVGVPPSHVLFNWSYGDCHAALGRENSAPPEDVIDVHGGITFSGYLDYLAPLGPYNVWWFGFDGAHLYDITRNPFMQLFRLDGATFKDVLFVTMHCEILSAQLSVIDESIVDSSLTGIERL